MVKITHCIFDMDGLLLDTERIYTEVSTEMLSRYNITYTWKLKSQIMGYKEYDAVAFIIKETGINISIEDFLEERAQKQNEKFPTAKPLPGVMKLVKHLKENNIPIVVATSSHKYSFEVKSKNNQELFSLFDDIICGDDPLIKHGKPSPDIFLLARKRLGNPPLENCLVFEDAVNGIKAALNAGMHVVWVPDPGLAEMYPENNGATEKLDSLESFDPSKYGLPSF